MSNLYLITHINKLYESIKPLNFVMRYLFQKYVCDIITECDFDEHEFEFLNEEYLGDDFLYEDLCTTYFDGDKWIFNLMKKIE